MAAGLRVRAHCASVALRACVHFVAAPSPPLTRHPGHPPPHSQFGGQEPGSNREIKAFAERRGARFPLFAKIDVNGTKEEPLWAYLKQQKVRAWGWGWGGWVVGSL